MRFTQAAQAPIVLEVGEEKITVPKFTLRDQVQWAAELDAARADAATRGMDPLQRFHTLNGFDVLPADLTELARRVRTPAGIDRICSTCLARGTGADGKPIGAERARGIMDANPDGLMWLAEQLADLFDRSKAGVPAPAGGESGDPLTESGKPEPVG